MLADPLCITGELNYCRKKNTFMNFVIVFYKGKRGAFVGVRNKTSLSPRCSLGNGHGSPVEFSSVHGSPVEFSSLSLQKPVHPNNVRYGPQ